MRKSMTQHCINCQQLNNSADIDAVLNDPDTCLIADELRLEVLSEMRTHAASARLKTQAIQHACVEVISQGGDNI